MPYTKPPFKQTSKHSFPQNAPGCIRNHKHSPHFTPISRLPFFFWGPWSVRVEPRAPGKSSLASPLNPPPSLSSFCRRRAMRSSAQNRRPSAVGRRRVARKRRIPLGAINRAPFLSLSLLHPFSSSRGQMSSSAHTRTHTCVCAGVLYRMRACGVKEKKREAILASRSAI